MSERKKFRKPTKQLKEIKLEHYVIFSLIMVLVYTIADFISSFWGVSHDGLTPYFFGVFGGEVLSCALIKIFKLRGQDVEDN